MTRLLILQAVLICALMIGCAAPQQAPLTAQHSWGPGVRDVERVKVMLAKVVKNNYGERGVGEAEGIMSTLTWDQATYLCRTAPEDIEYTVVMYVIDNSDCRLIGLTRKELIALLGPRCCQMEDQVVYGDCCDSGSGFVFFFDESGHVETFSHAN